VSRDEPCLTLLLFPQDVKANASSEVDIGGIEIGQSVTVKWRGKPVFVRHRGADEIAAAGKVDVSTLKDPQVGSTDDRDNTRKTLLAAPPPRMWR